MGWSINSKALFQKSIKIFETWRSTILQVKKIVISWFQGVHTPSSFKFFHEILDLGPPVNAPAHNRSPIFMYNVALTLKSSNHYLVILLSTYTFIYSVKTTCWSMHMYTWILRRPLPSLPS